MSVQDYTEEIRDIAFKILIEISEIDCCVYHNDYYFRNFKFDNNEIYAMATNKYKLLKGEENIVDYALFHDAIKYILDNAGDSSECPICEANIQKIISE